MTKLSILQRLWVTFIAFNAVPVAIVATTHIAYAFAGLDPHIVMEIVVPMALFFGFCAAGAALAVTQP